MTRRRSSTPRSSTRVTTKRSQAERPRSARPRAPRSLPQPRSPATPAAPRACEPTKRPPRDPRKRAAVENDLDALLAETQRERDEYLELAQRTKADFENYRKRMARRPRPPPHAARRSWPGKSCRRSTISSGRFKPPGSIRRGTRPTALAHGVLLVFREPAGGADAQRGRGRRPEGRAVRPRARGALTLPAEGTEPGTVVEVLQKGYRLGDQLIRPARVVVERVGGLG